MDGPQTLMMSRPVLSPPPTSGDKADTSPCPWQSLPCGRDTQSLEMGNSCLNQAQLFRGQAGQYIPNLPNGL